jgi:putative transposase
MVLELPANPQLLDVITGIPASRTVFHYGIELDGLHYNSRELQEIRRSVGESLKVQLKFYEDQVGFIHVLDPKINEYFRVDCVHMEFAHIHRQTYRLTRADARKRYGERHTIPQLLDSLSEIQEIIKQAVKDKKMGQRKLAARHKSHDTNATFEDKNNDIPAQKGPELPPGLDDDLPDIDTKNLDDES